VDKYLENATEVDVDCICDTKQVYIAGIMEHIEEAGIHSGDSACSLPPFSLSEKIIRKLEEASKALAIELGVRGLMNVQYAIRDGEVYVIEVNPRASRTVPFVSKATGIPVAKMATKVMFGMTLRQLGLSESPRLSHVSVKESVFPWTKFPGVDAVLGPEMKSTGEVMGIDDTFPMAFARGQIASGLDLPTEGRVFLSVKNSDKKFLDKIAVAFHDMGFKLVATGGTAGYIRNLGVPVKTINKVSEGKPNIVDLIINDDVDLIINTPSGKKPRQDEVSIRTTAVRLNIPLVTTMGGAHAMAEAINGLKAAGNLGVTSLQEWHG